MQFLKTFPEQRQAVLPTGVLITTGVPILNIALERD
jgi:hypothetical protein